MTAQPSSLAVLAPASSIKHPSLRSTPVEEYLKDLSRAITETHNTRDFTDPVFAHLSPTFVAHHEAGLESIHTTTPANMIARWKAMLDRMPDYYTEIMDCLATANELTGRGRVWVLRTARGLEGGLKQETVSEFTWERREGKWWLVRYRGLRGFAWYESETFMNLDDDESSPEMVAG